MGGRDCISLSAPFVRKGTAAFCLWSGDCQGCQGFDSSCKLALLFVVFRKRTKTGQMFNATSVSWSPAGSYEVYCYCLDILMETGR